MRMPIHGRLPARRDDRVEALTALEPSAAPHGREPDVRGDSRGWPPLGTGPAELGARPQPRGAFRACANGVRSCPASLVNVRTVTARLRLPPRRWQESSLT